MSTLNYKATRNLTILGGMFGVGVFVMLVQWWFGVAPIVRFHSTEAFYAAVIVNSVVSISCFIVASALERARPWAYILGGFVGLLALTGLPLGLGNVMGASVIYFVLRAWLDKDTRALLESDASAPSDAPAATVKGASPKQMLVAIVGSFLLGGGVVALMGVQLVGGERLVARPRMPDPGPGGDVGARFYALAAESRNELGQIEALRVGDTVKAGTLVASALAAHMRTLEHYEDAVAPGDRSDFVVDTIAAIRRFDESMRNASTVSAPRSPSNPAAHSTDTPTHP